MNPGMTQRPKPIIRRPRRPPPPVFIGAWVKRLGVKQVEIAKKAEIGESYMSLLVSGAKYPGPAVKRAIADALRIPESALHQMPPDEETVRALAGLDPSILARLDPKNPD
jgi:transcriptional regulator with XRE-family HTH domain